MEVGSVSGVRVRASFWLLPMAIMAIWLGDIATLAVSFLSITVHELAHAAAAKRVGLQVLEIELMPFGGVARLQSAVARGPGAELSMALAGPAASFILAWGLSFMERSGWVGGKWCAAIISTNMSLACFNLLPALPLDGGRVLRALLTGPMGFQKATRLASCIGVAIGLGVLGLGVIGAIRGIWNIMLLGVGAFLTVAALREGRQAAYALGKTLVQNRRHLARGPVRVRTLAARSDSPLGEVARGMVPGEYHVVSVLDAHLRMMGTLDEGGFSRALDAGGASTTLEEALRISSRGR
nr:M50 family metallopeptidase [bacterium]